MKVETRGHYSGGVNICPDQAVAAGGTVFRIGMDPFCLPKDKESGRNPR